MVSWDPADASIEMWLPDVPLTKLDVWTVVVPSEARSPLLAPDLVELMLSVPERVAFPGGRSKALLAPLVRKYLPESLHHRRKTGFGVPLRQCLLGLLREGYTRYVLRPGRTIHEWISPEAARVAYPAMERGSVRAERVWALLVLGVWGAVTLEGTIGSDEPLAGAA